MSAGEVAPVTIHAVLLASLPWRVFAEIKYFPRGVLMLSLPVKSHCLDSTL